MISSVTTFTRTETFTPTKPSAALEKGFERPSGARADMRQKATKVLGWNAEVPFEEGMQRTIAWYREAKGID